MSLGPNDLEPCPSRGARKRHLAVAEQCAVCGTEGRTTPRQTLVSIIQLRRAASRGDAA